MRVISSFSAPPKTCSISVSEDGTHAFISHQQIGTEVSIWDISNLQNPQYIQNLPSFSSNQSLPHSTLVRENFLWVSHFADGVAVYDISNPSLPTLLSKYDTSPYREGSHGAWAVYPFDNNAKIFVSDIEQGVYAFALQLSNGNSQNDSNLTFYAGAISMVIGLLLGALLAFWVVNTNSKSKSTKAFQYDDSQAMEDENSEDDIIELDTISNK